MSRYERLARQAWRSGEYRAADASDAGALREDGEALRARLRSKMEWVVEREAWSPWGKPSAGRTGGLRLAAHARFRPEGPGGFLYDTRSERVWRVPPSGAAALGALAGAVDEEDWLRALHQGFDDRGGTLEREARAFLSELRAAGLLEDSPR